jgi:hypothetical protein
MTNEKKEPFSSSRTDFIPACPLNKAFWYKAHGAQLTIPRDSIKARASEGIPSLPGKSNKSGISPSKT